MHKYLFLIAFLISSTVFSQITVQLQAPSQAEVGQQMRISYVINTKDIDDFQLKEVSPDFRILYGPSTSSQRSYSMVNGKTSSSSSVTITYMVQPTKEGVLSIPVGVAVIKGKSYSSRSGKVEVLPASQSSGSHSHSRGESSANSDTHVAAIGNKDLYIDVTASKTKVYEQEAVLLTYKLYTLVNIQQISGEMPELDGFHVQELNSKAQMSLKYESVNGRNYGTAVWRQYVLYPQKTGKLVVPSIKFEAQVEVHNTSMDPFDIFFGGGSLSQLVTKQIKTPEVKLEVQPLPSPRPDHFSGAVGAFTLNGSFTPEQLKANDAATLRLEISGQGNMQLMKSPVVDFPKDFEVYNPKKEDKVVHTSVGAKGKVIYDYVVVPRHGGKYKIPSVEFCYFDPNKAKYQVLKTSDFHVSVAKSANEGRGGVQSQEDLEVLSNDIRFIKLGHVRLSTDDSSFFASTAYWMIYILLSLVFIVFMVVFRRYIRENANNTRQRVKKARKAANKRLRIASKLLQEHNSDAFYDEIMSALLGYAGDKLNLRTADLNKENVRAALLHRGVDEVLINDYLDVIAQCEFARFAPGDPEATMDRIYSEADEVINRLNVILK